MKVLVVGNGGREHALAWKLACSTKVEHVYVAPGNAGTALENKTSNLDIAATDITNLTRFAKDNRIDLTVVGPEVPLVAGIVDIFEEQHLTVLGPCSYAAQLEGSKSFAKRFMREFGIPSAPYEEFTDIESAIEYANQLSGPIVIKADGLAAGKGVVITEDKNEAVTTLRSMLSGKLHGIAGQKVVVERFLKGEEASFICVVDGTTILPLATSQDHKARDEGDRGPNTGGMGAYSPTSVISEELHRQIIDKVIRPVVEGMRTRGHSYRGFLYAGLMIEPDQSFNVLEFNCRFGDPETQPVLMRLDSDFAELCLRAATSALKGYKASWDTRSALTVVMASQGYPEKYHTGYPISGLDLISDERVKIFHAGTKQQGEQVVTSGGRVLCVTALGTDVADAQTGAYRATQSIQWEGAFYRKDIGYREINRKKPV